MANRYRHGEGYPDWRWHSPAVQPLRLMPASYSLGKKDRRVDNASMERRRDRPHIIDVIGNGPETTICGHIDLLYRLPLHNGMHRKLLETFRDKPGNYEGKYNDGAASKANVTDYGKGYLAIHFNNDVTRPEMSEFLLAHGWKLLNAHCTEQHGKEVIYEKWTNVLDSSAKPSRQRSRSHSRPRRYY